MLVGFLPDSAAISFGASKLFQILVPLVAYIVLREFLLRPTHLRKLAQLISPNRSPEIHTYWLSLVLGFMSWKVGCDLGFLIVATGVAPWDRAFTWAGLIPYTMVQYLVYYLVGQKILIQGQINPFREVYTARQIPRRPSRWRQFFSKYFHESMNATSYNVPLRQVVLKPAIDYGSIVLSWSIYNSGLLFLQTGEVNFAPLIHFTFLQIFAFYIVNVFGFILGFNVGEILFNTGIELLEALEGWGRRRKWLASPDDQALTTVGARLQYRWKEFHQTNLWQTHAFLNRYGISPRWAVTALFGVLFVIYLEPSLARATFSVSGGGEAWWFFHVTPFDYGHAEQALSAAHLGAKIDPSQGLLENFPSQWGNLYFVAEPDV